MHSFEFLAETAKIAKAIDFVKIENIVSLIVFARSLGGRVFLIGLGGSAANASHAANDFRKLCGIQAYCLTDNVAEFTARANDEGWDSVFVGSLEAFKPTSNDVLFVLSVGGGTDTVSTPIVKAITTAKMAVMGICGIVGRDGGYAAKSSDCIAIIPTVYPARVTPHVEAFQMVLLHCIVSHPDLQRNATKW